MLIPIDFVDPHRLCWETSLRDAAIDTRLRCVFRDVDTVATVSGTFDISAVGGGVDTAVSQFSILTEHVVITTNLGNNH